MENGVLPPSINDRTVSLTQLALRDAAGVVPPTYQFCKENLIVETIHEKVTKSQAWFLVPAA